MFIVLSSLCASCSLRLSPLLCIVELSFVYDTFHSIKNNSDAAAGKAQSVIWIIKTKSLITGQQNYRREYGDSSPTNKTIILNRGRQFNEKGSVLNVKPTDRPPIPESTMKLIRTSCVPSPKT